MSDGTHADFLAELAEDHQRRLGDAIINLEDKITDLMSGAPLTDGEFFDLEWAVESRNELRKIIDKEYLEEVDKIVKDYSGVAERATDMLSEYGDFTNLDKGVVNQLQSLTFQGFEAVGDQYLTAVSKEIYDMTLVGTSFSDAVKNVRETVGGNLKRYADQQVHDGLMQFNANANVAIGKQSGVTKWKYYGGLQDNSRSHCRKHVGKVYTEEEIAEIWSGSWQGKASGDPFVVRGGYRCQHHWRPVFDEEVVQEVVEEVAPPPEPEPVTELQTKPIKRLAKAAAVKSAQKKLTKQFKPVAEKDFYSYPLGDDGQPVTRFKGYGYKRGMTKQDRIDKFVEQSGKVTGTSFNAETLTLVDGALDITSDLSKKYKIPQVRSITPTSSRKAAMSMGDGNLSISAGYWNARTQAAFLDDKEIVDKILKQRAANTVLEKDFELLREKLKDAKTIYFADRTNFAEYKEISKEYNAKIDAINRGRKKVAKLEASVQVKPASTWKVGDDLVGRPYGADEYFEDNIDKFNNVFTHEYGHLLHQEYNRIGNEQGGIQTPVERYLDSLFFKKGTRQRNADRIFPTEYSEYNSKEWFAESFSLYNMGRKDLVDPKIIDFLEEVEKTAGHISSFDGFNFVTGGRVL